MFKIGPDTPVRTLADGSGIQIVSGPGGCPWVVDLERPHLGGNFDGGDLGTWYKEDLWPWLIDTFNVKTMLDVGCGTGESMRWFTGRGIEASGIEGLPWNVQKCNERGPEKIILHDFKEGPCQVEKVDLMWCADVAEHIEEEYVDNFIKTLTQCRVLAMCQGGVSNAEDGWHHVNNQPSEYWKKKLKVAGMVEDTELTAKSLEIGNHGWGTQSGKIYIKTEKPKKATKSTKVHKSNV